MLWPCEYYRKYRPRAGFLLDLHPGAAYGPTPHHAGFLLDLHASCYGNPHLPYVELYPYLDSLWFGEQCEYAAPPATPRHATYPPRPATYPPCCATPHMVAAPTTYGCTLRHLRLQPPPPTVAGTRATRRRSGWRRCRASPSGCPHLPISPCISLYLPLSQVSGVPFGLPGQILGTNAEQAQVRAARGGGVCSGASDASLLCLLRTTFTVYSPLATCYLPRPTCGYLRMAQLARRGRYPCPWGVRAYPYPYPYP